MIKGIHPEFLKGPVVWGQTPLMYANTRLRQVARQFFESEYDAEAWADARIAAVLREKLCWPGRDSFVASEVAKLVGQTDMFVTRDDSEAGQRRQRRLDVADAQPTFVLGNPGCSVEGDPVLSTDIWKIPGDPREVHVENYGSYQMASIVVGDAVLDTRRFTAKSMEALREKLLQPALKGAARRKFLEKEMEDLRKQFNHVDAKAWQMKGNTTRNLKKKAAKAANYVPNPRDKPVKVKTWAELIPEPSRNELPRIKGEAPDGVVDTEAEEIIAKLRKQPKQDACTATDLIFAANSEEKDPKAETHIRLEVFDGWQRACLISRTGGVLDTREFEARDVEKLRQRLSKKLANGDF